ncbi:MAG: hypothetical protein COT74_13710 [Bdellovibrionales bacterium CG10_big_fil_rev_8_21_14_0_10_45_34]|nr:MAG: hypothetical protein COT74_13710 [Bdellovibrionales bacterium CG10_big_fil_rev_8_21_14_0_10_45_34]
MIRSYLLAITVFLSSGFLAAQNSSGPDVVRPQPVTVTVTPETSEWALTLVRPEVQKCLRTVEENFANLRFIEFTKTIEHKRGGRQIVTKFESVAEARYRKGIDQRDPANPGMAHVFLDLIITKKSVGRRAVEVTVDCRLDSEPRY